MDEHRLKDIARLIKHFAARGLIVDNDLLPLERFFITWKWALVPLPLLIIIFGGMDLLSSATIAMWLLFTLNIVSYLIIRFVRQWRPAYSAALRVWELLGASIVLTYIHLIINSFDFNGMYVIVLVLAVLAGGYRVAAILLSITFPLVMASNIIVSTYTPSDNTFWGAISNAIANEVAFIMLSFLALWLVAKSNRYRIESELDGLTGLYNHRYFYKVLMERLELSPDRTIAVILADIDDFKQINDRYGHLVGDEVLRDISHVLRDSLAEPAVVARYGGEEFAILCTKGQIHEIYTKLEKVRHTLASLRFDTAEGTLRGVTLSFGLAYGKAEENEATEWVRLADQALYSAKMQGKDRIELGDSQDTTA